MSARQAHRITRAVFGATIFATICATIGAIIGTVAITPLALSAAAPAGTEDARAQRHAEFLYEFFSATGRRANPTRQQIDWRTRAARVDETRWPSELELRAIDTVLGHFFGALQGRAFDATEIEALFAADFRGTRLHKPHGIAGERGGLRWSHWKIGGEPALNPAAFAMNWQERYQQFDRIIRTEHHVDGLASIANGTARRLTVPFRITGFRDGRGYEDQGKMTVEFVRHPADGHWQLQRLDLAELETLESRQLFTLEPLVREAPPVDTPLTPFVDYFAQGLSVVDIDGDGDMDIFAPTRFTSPRLLVNEGDRRFREAGNELGLGGIRGARSGYFFDWDNDGDQDLLVLTALRLHLLEQRGGRFTDVSGLSGFDRMSTTGLTGATVADFDNDGLLDFYVANYGDLANSPVLDYFDSRRGFKNQLFRNAGLGRFTMVTRPAGLDADNTRWTFAALAFDYDRDGWQDLYVVNDYGPNQLYRNRGDLTFEDVTEAAGVTDFGNGMGVSLGDLDQDGHEDLYVSNMISHAGKRIAASDNFPGDGEARVLMTRFAKGNTLMKGTPDGGFREVPTPELSDAKWAWGNSLFDYDNDGDLDVYVTNGMYTNLRRSDVDPVFWRHLLASISTGKPPGAYSSGYFAYLIQQESFSFAGNERNRLFQNFGDARFRDAAPALGADLVLDSRGVAAADLDDDGDLDLVISSRNEPRLVVYWNEIPNPGNRIAIDLEGRRSNRDGVGARVTVECGGAKQIAGHRIGAGYVSQEPHRLWFGLGDCADVDRIHVEWPSGASTVVEEPGDGETVTVVESTPPG